MDTDLINKNLLKYICNNCKAPFHRGIQPFSLTQCGHVFCQGCIKKAEKLCVVCHQVGVLSVELREPSLARVNHFFKPLSEEIITFGRINEFQSGQMLILQQRFHDLDQKYECLKVRYTRQLHQLKTLNEKYCNAVMKLEKCQKLMKTMRTQGFINSTSDITTPSNSASSSRIGSGNHCTVLSSNSNFTVNLPYGRSIERPFQFSNMEPRSNLRGGFCIPKLTTQPSVSNVKSVSSIRRL